jgi:hypothetical protein
VLCPSKEIFFGGTRGGGKTDGVLGKWALKDRRYGFAATFKGSRDSLDHGTKEAAILPDPWALVARF